MTEQGTVKFWREDGTFGFIAPDLGGHDVFAHSSRGDGMPKRGDRVEFES